MTSSRYTGSQSSERAGCASHDSSCYSCCLLSRAWSRSERETCFGLCALDGATLSTRYDSTLALSAVAWPIARLLS